MGEVARGRKTRTTKSVDKEGARSCELLESDLTDLILQPKSGKIARPPNAFMLFAREHRKALATKYADQTNKVISSMLGKCWQKMDPTSKDQYFAKAKMMQQLHKQKYPGYVYSPRLARIKKLEKRSNRKNKNSTKQVMLEGNEQGENNIKIIRSKSAARYYLENVNLKCGMTKTEEKGDDPGIELKSTSPGYIPNNPQFFSEIKPESNSMDPNTETQNSTDHQVYNSLEYISPPRFPPSTCGRTPEEFGMKPASHPDTFYHRQTTMPIACRCQTCAEHRASYCYAPPMHPRWTSHEMDYVKEYADPSLYRREYSGLPPHTSPLFSLYQHRPSSLRTEINPAYQYNRGPFQECISDLCSLPTSHMKWKISHEDQTRTFYRNMGDCYNHPPELSTESCPRIVRLTTPACDFNSHFDIRPRLRPVAHCGIHVDEPYFQPQEPQNVHCVVGSIEDVSSQKLEVNNFEVNVNIPQFVTNTDQPYCQDSGSNDHSQDDHQSYDCEPNSTDQNQNLQKIEATYLQADEINPQVSYVNEFSHGELELNNQCKSEGTRNYVLYESEGFCSQGFEHHNAYHSDDEIINVVDVVEEADQNSSALEKEEFKLDDLQVSANEPFIPKT